jgi:hypothetical protein
MRSKNKAKKLKTYKNRIHTKKKYNTKRKYNSKKKYNTKRIKKRNKRIYGGSDQVNALINIYGLLKEVFKTEKTYYDILDELNGGVVILWSQLTFIKSKFTGEEVEAILPKIIENIHTLHLKLKGKLDPLHETFSEVVLSKLKAPDPTEISKLLKILKHLSDIFSDFMDQPDLTRIYAEYSFKDIHKSMAEKLNDETSIKIITLSGIQDYASKIITPVQRIMRYQMLFTELDKHFKAFSLTEAYSNSKNNIQLATILPLVKEKTKGTCSKVNEKLRSLEKQLASDKADVGDLVEEGDEGSDGNDELEEKERRRDEIFHIFKAGTGKRRNYREVLSKAPYLTNKLKRLSSKLSPSKNSGKSPVFVGSE